MYRPVLAPPSHSQPWQDTWARLLIPLTVWICVSVSLRYGFYGDCRMVLGPSSSRLMKANSVFVQQVEVRGGDSKKMHLYAFSEKPQLSLESNWSVSNYLIVASYGRKGFSLWLNKGSRIRLRWEAEVSNLEQLQVVMIKGERKYETLPPTLTNSPASLDFSEPIDGKETEYKIDDNDKYYIEFVNGNRRSMVIILSVNVSSKMYDVTQAKTVCSTSNGSCGLCLQFPQTQYLILTTSDDGDIGGWYVELSFVARMITYIAILGVIVIIIFLILKYLGACESDSIVVEPAATEIRIMTENDPILPQKINHHTYGTIDEDELSRASSSCSEELYDEKLCVICYDEQRNCFFVPCGHCATCHDCAQRIMEEENKVCPICRRLIHKTRKLFNS